MPISKEAKNTIGVSEQIRKHAFSMPKPVAGKSSWDKVLLTAGDQAVMAVFKVENTDEAMNSNDIARITNQLGNTDYNSYVQYQKSQADISISETAIEVDSNQQ